VVSEIRGNIDLIEAGKGGYLIEPEDTNGFAESILRLIDDAGLRVTLGNHNITEVKKYDIAAVKAEMQKIYCREIN
jgi:glycosyltransferase involved in cell wall biosynthesis